MTSLSSLHVIQTFITRHGVRIFINEEMDEVFLERKKHALDLHCLQPFLICTSYGDIYPAKSSLLLAMILQSETEWKIHFQDLEYLI